MSNNTSLAHSVMQEYVQNAESFAKNTFYAYVDMKPQIDKFNKAWRVTQKELLLSQQNNHYKCLYIAFSNSRSYFKNIADVRDFFRMLRPDQRDSLKRRFGTKEVKESLGFYGSGQHAYIKYLTKAMMVFMKNYYGEDDYEDQIHRIWGIYK